MFTHEKRQDLLCGCGRYGWNEPRKIFKGISKWANQNYGKDIFLSNVVTNKKKHTIMVYSKVELLLNEEGTDKTLVTYRLEIACKEGSYTCRLTDITYQYNPNNHRNFINFPAEDVIANGGRDNKVAIIKDPKLFCNATFSLPKTCLETCSTRWMKDQNGNAIL